MSARRIRDLDDRAVMPALGIHRSTVSALL